MRRLASPSSSAIVIAAMTLEAHVPDLAERRPHLLDLAVEHRRKTFEMPFLALSAGDAVGPARNRDGNL